MEKVLSNEQMVEADSYTINALGVPSAELMRRAGIAIANEVKSVYDKTGIKDIVVVCGTGNNGGDGYVIAEELKRRGLPVKVYAIDGNLSPDCARERAAYTGEYAEEISADIIVDCIFGTGLAREVSGKYAQIIEKINGSGAYVVSADIPSGINGDNGLVEGCAVKARLTVAVAELKTGYFLNDGPDFCGDIVVKDIGIVLPESRYAYIYEDGDIGNFYPKRKRNSHKGSYGSAQLVAGSGRYTGAAALAAGAALKSGCGYVKLYTDDSVRLALAAGLPQVIYGEEPDLSSDAMAIGPGCGVSQSLYNIIKEVLQSYGGKLFIDADGLNVLAKYGTDILKDKRCRTALTPHLKEFSALSGLSVAEIKRDPIAVAERFANEYKVTLLLKSSVSVLTDGYTTALLHRGNSALSKGGSGDMLTGYACGTAARGLNCFDAAAVASYTLGMAAEICATERTEYCVTAKDLIKNLHRAVLHLTR